MGGKHPAPGPLFIVSQHTGHALACDHETGRIHTTPVTDSLDPRGAAGWSIRNIPNDEALDRMGFNLISHNQRPSQFLGCDSEGKLIVSPTTCWDSCSGWRLIQQRDTDIFECICFHRYWMAVDDQGRLAMRTKDALHNDAKQHWRFRYIEKQHILHKIPTIDTQHKANEDKDQQEEKTSAYGIKESGLAQEQEQRKDDCTLHTDKPGW